MYIEPFGVEIWMNEFEKSCELNLAETCVESMTVAEFLALCGREESSLLEVLPFKMTYGAIEGSDRLRDAIAGIASDAGAWLLCDEVYRGTDQEGPGSTTSVVDLYDKGISTAGMSKAFSLAGLRVGWLAGPEEVVEQVMIHRDYNTISVGILNDHYAALALESHEAILDRSQQITRENLAILAKWVESEPLISWIRPHSGTTTLLKYDLDIPSRDFCIRLLEETGVMFTPGSPMDMEGYVRIGYANSSAVLKAGLKRVSGFLRMVKEND